MLVATHMLIYIQKRGNISYNDSADGIVVVVSEGLDGLGFSAAGVVHDHFNSFSGDTRVIDIFIITLVFVVGVTMGVIVIVIVVVVVVVTIVGVALTVSMGVGLFATAKIAGFLLTKSTAEILDLGFTENNKGVFSSGGLQDFGIIDV